MILFDFSQIIISTTIDFFQKTKEPIEADLLRHLALNTIFSTKKKLSGFGDEIVLCMDGRNYWRKNIFQLYKQNRKLHREEDQFDWDNFFNFMTVIKGEFKYELPYKVVEVDTAEADDVISVISRRCAEEGERVVIVSSDKDFLQLQYLFPAHIFQFCPKRKKLITINESFVVDMDRNSQLGYEVKEYSLFEHIVRGDAKDGIPNILSDDDTFMISGKRSKIISSKKMIEWREYGLDAEKFCTSISMLEKFVRNRLLIDLTQIPEYLQEKIISEFKSGADKGKPSLYDYLVKHKLVKIMQTANF